jgi:Arc/MetJ-type ribon-helix-helix transcriptional regulator
MIHMSLKLPKQLNNRVKSLALKRKTSASAIVRDALEKYLAAETGSFEGSVLDLTQDLVGSVTGPADLSTGKRYSRKYGR